MDNKEDIFWQKVVAGDAAAWETTVRKYQSLVYTIALRSGLSMADAADCFQHTWMVFWENRRKINDPSRLSAWLATTAKRESLRLLKQRASGGQQLDEQQVDGNPLPDEELERLEKHSQLENAIRELGTRCRKLMDLMFFEPEDSSYREIAGKLDVAVNSLGPLRKRCMDSLRKILIRNGFL